MNNARITLKKGVRLGALQPQVVLGLVVAAGCYGLRDMEEMVVTSCNDSKHGRGSLHYSGNAVDLRTNTAARIYVEGLHSDIVLALGVDFDVILEDYGTPNEHIHMEYQPKD